MVASSKVESLNEHFLPYVDELRELFQSRQLSYGQPTDLQELAQRLAEPQFHEEMVSMVRAMQYREEERLSRTDLMEILTTASGGPDFTDQQVAPTAVQVISTFVTDLLHPRRQAHDLLHESSAQAEDGSVVAHDLPHPGDEPGHPQPVGSSLQVDASQPAPPEVALTAPAWIRSEVKYPARATPLGFLGRAYWIPGVLALLLVSAVVWVLHRKPGLVDWRSTPPPAQQLSTSADQTLAMPRAPHREMRGPHAMPSTPALSPRTIAPAQKPESRTGEEVPARSAESSLRPRPTSRTRHLWSEPVPALSGVSPREGVFLASSGTMASHLLFAPAPAYPKLAHFAHVQGQVIVQVVVSRKGSVAATRVLEGPLLLRSAAEHAIRHWRYRPYLIDGKPTDVAAIVTVTYRIGK